ncbi:ABC transporter ATP-binding protein [Cohnella xylanilytica]|uniref:ABC transporter ATP-binding protein n=1 Tax=Cohnella xylanilytica TaxID=557555 RepID=A0A841U6K6_9BACL|nr:ABC transporter ATP-binding protein [Cohnella xylanilytica]MBB6695282.1 ABC transporter ATP-binding protein [Cohnella xylanilytica]
MIEVVNVRKRYRRRYVLDGLSFAAEKGRITCLAGLNGAGKSTALKVIMGLAPYQEGAVRLDGKPIDRSSRERISFVPDRIAMPSSMKLADALQFMADFYASWNGARARELMRFFDLKEGDKVGSLSKGMAAKFNLVLGLAPDTDYVVMDEPFSGIDVFGREAVASVFSSEWVEGRGVLITTHEIAEIEHLIDHVVLLKDGRAVRSFDTERVRDEEGKSVVDVMREVLLA